jgi:thiazolinyl reductase component of yersiniabactin synthetase
MNRIRVLVCGTNYGRAYLSAISRRADAFELVGVLARGSSRSHQVADENGVPLYVDLREMGKNVDLACAAMNSSAWPVIMKLLERGVHVLCEHPQRTAALMAGLRLGLQRKVRFHLNAHFGDLPAARAFAKECSRLRKKADPVFLQALATERSLYGLLDILKRSLGSLDPCRMRVLHREKRFCLLRGTLGHLPSHLLVQISGTKRGRHLPDGSPAYLFDHRVAVAFPDGVLTLMSMSGPVVWNSAPARTLGARDSLWTNIYDQGTRTRGDLRQQRIEANIAALESIRTAILYAQTADTQRPNHILEVSRAWESICRRLYAA